MIDACKTPPRHLPIRYKSGAVIRIQMIRSDTRYPDRRRRHQGRACCEVAGRRFETQGPAAIYKLTTLLWLHSHGGTDFEVWDDLSPLGKPGGLAMRGKVRCNNSRRWGARRAALIGRTLPKELPAGAESFDSVGNPPNIRRYLLIPSQFSQIMQRGKSAPAEVRLAAALEAGDNLDARIVLLTLHASVIQQSVVERYGLGAS